MFCKVIQHIQSHDRPVTPSKSEVTAKASRERRRRERRGARRRYYAYLLNCICTPLFVSFFFSHHRISFSVCLFFADTHPCRSGWCGLHRYLPMDPISLTVVAASFLKFSGPCKRSVGLLGERDTRGAQGRNEVVCGEKGGKSESCG